VDLPKTSPSGVEPSEDPFVLVIQANQILKIGQAPVSLTDLRKKISAIFEHRKNKQVYIQADRKVDYGVVAEAMAEVKAAGITNIGLITLPKDK
jgi:biopolymer transport protein TolR